MCKYVWPDQRPVVWTGEDCRLREVWFTCSRIAAKQFRNDASLKRLDRRASSNSKNLQWTMVTDVAHDDRHLVRMVMNERTSSRQLKTRWYTATVLLMSSSLIWRRLLHRGLCARVSLYRIPLMANHRKLRHHWAYEHKVWQAITKLYFQMNLKIQFVGTWWLRSY